MLRREECRVSTSNSPLRSNLSFTRRRVNLAQTPSATWLVFPRTRLFCIEEKRRVANPEHARPEIPAIFFESGSAETRSKPQREFSQSLLASFSSGRHLGCPRGQTALPTVARCTVAMWTDGRSARPLTWARRTQVRVFARTQPHATPYASTPRLPESAPSAPLTRGHSPAATPVPTLTSPLRAQTKAARSGASCAPDARAKGAARCWCTRRYAHGEDACVRETCHKNA